ncbi:translesion DNA synthesis-associated protein ImuA [Halopseudomonas pertucinogena]|uniref:CDP-6-deoxy-delta-3,4-glucoseen reductase n=1 Tax=Halopseudomonas pertucinogena TaxID=86175 RepID=A0ABQ2CI85_9GAMM|nr:translesion DNA synthesis-associated protein ImuA [Halopseudomonas pertucinogena]GGI90453.1 CDP-6-deoxy-delta-3,4-glucoseen reductase [Halopseudomonas pertucinogena]
MSAVVSLDALLQQRRVWKGGADIAVAPAQPTGHAQLDAVLPGGGWPEAALSELLLAHPGSGELQLLWPTLARLTRARERVVLVAPPFIPFAPAWLQAGVDLRWLVLVQASEKEALWAAEQCLRSGSCAAVLCWPERINDRGLRRLQLAAATGESLGFACRSLREADNPSPAALRLALDAWPRQVRVLKSRGAMPAARPLALG